MDDEEKEHYTKLLTFTLGISLDVLHLYFDIKILDKEEFFLFLDRCKHMLFHALHPTKSCCKCKNGSIPLSQKAPTLYPDQFNSLFDIEISTLQCLHNKTVQHCLCKYSASRSVTVDSLDISLVYAIIKTCCTSIHGDPQWIKDVKDTRNFLAHKNNCRLTKDEYDTWLNTVEKATLDLAKVVSSTFLKTIQKQISDFKKDVPFSNTVKDILESSQADVCKRLESFMKNLVTNESKSMSKDIIDHIKKYKGMDATPVTGGVEPRETNTPKGRSEVQQPGFIPTISKEEYDRKFYKVNSGRVLVLNNEEFIVPDIDLGDRHGSSVDASMICQRFQEIGFEYDLETNMTKKEIFRWFEKAKIEMIANPVDCFVLVLLSHGTVDGIYARDSIIQIEDIIEVFNATNCPQLRFKPKVLIIQSCRETNFSLGVDVRVDPNQADSKPDDGEYIEPLEMQKIHPPNEADFLFAYATVPGAKAFRHCKSGSPFIRHLSEAMEKMEVNEDFYSVLTTVSNAVGLTYQPRNESLQLNKVVQMPCFVSHLTKVLRLKQST